jgi:23S rRNA G2069 N7-methylase RlmK/C1962 C5-methylase RlmI
MEKTAAQAEMFANRLKKRLRHLRKWAKRTGTEAFRLYDRDIPEIPLLLDVYGDIASGALYKRPYEKDQAEEAAWLACMRNAAAQALGTAPDNIVIKCRERQRGQAQYEKQAGHELIRIINEGKFKFKVNLTDYLDTGLFLDRRALRRMIRADSDGKRALNLFCYTASFSVAAAGGGALSTDSVDLSNPYLGWARENFALNGFNAEITRTEDLFPPKGSPKGKNGKNRLIRADVAAFLQGAAEAGLRWDSIVVDPPAFSNSAMARADFDLRRDGETLLSGCLALLAPGGAIWFSASARSYKADAGELETLLAKHFPGTKVTDISAKTVDEDFKGRRTPKTFVITDSNGNFYAGQ